MTAPLSRDPRRRLVRALEEGSSARAAAARFEISASAVIKLVRRVRATGSTAPAKIGGYRRPLLTGHEEFLRTLTTLRKGITLAAIRQVLVERGLEPGSLTTIRSTPRRLGLSHKKVAEGIRAGSTRRRRPSPAMACPATLPGPGRVRVPG